jgi:Flp pilus assembly protein TadD
MGSNKGLLKATALNKIRTRTTTEKGKTLAEASTKKRTEWKPHMML